jgi:hypothetical protein
MVIEATFHTKMFHCTYIQISNFINYMTIKVASAQVLLTILAQRQNAQKQSTAGVADTLHMPSHPCLQADW